MKIYLIGFMGSGKTTVAKLFSKEKSLKFIDTDSVMEERLNRSVADIFQMYGEPFFREMEKKFLTEIEAVDDAIISTGGGMPCYNDNMDKMNLSGSTVYLRANTETLKKRLLEKTISRPLLNNIEPDHLHSFIFQKLKEREPYYCKASLVVETDNYLPEQIVEVIHAYYASKIIV